MALFSDAKFMNNYTDVTSKKRSILHKAVLARAYSISMHAKMTPEQRAARLCSCTSCQERTEPPFALYSSHQSDNYAFTGEK